MSATKTPLAGPPETIYLQWYGEDSPQDGEPLAVTDDITWSADQINRHDVEYRRVAKMTQSSDLTGCGGGLDRLGGVSEKS